jgi:hypothetical protein
MATAEIDPATDYGRFSQTGDPPWLAALCAVANGEHASAVFPEYKKLAEAIRFLVVYYRHAERTTSEARAEADRIRRVARDAMNEAIQAVVAVEQRNRSLWGKP